MNTKKYTISKKAKELGFQLIGFTEPKIDAKETNRYKNYLESNYHGDMKWLEKQFELKNKPKKLWEGVKTILILGINYGPGFNPQLTNLKKNIANISVYARNNDYHFVIKNKLEALKRFLDENFSIKSKYFVDSSPVFEKTLAQHAGLGWVGKHTNLVSQKIGSWFFLSEMFLSETIENDIYENDKCGECSKCLNSCPTDAFDSEYKIDSRKCISYLTIEYKGVFPMSLRSKVGNKVYGCDDCLSVCPWNKFSFVTSEKEFKAKNKLISPELKSFLNLKEENFRSFFNKSPIKRIGWIRFMRNTIIASGNSKNKDLVIYLIEFLKNEHAILRGASVWAIKKLEKKETFLKLKRKYFFNEKNAYVKFEWECN